MDDDIVTIYIRCIELFRYFEVNVWGLGIKFIYHTKLVAITFPYLLASLASELQSKAKEANFRHQTHQV